MMRKREQQVTDRELGHQNLDNLPIQKDLIALFSTLTLRYHFGATHSQENFMGL